MHHSKGGLAFACQAASKVFLLRVMVQTHALIHTLTPMKARMHVPTHIINVNMGNF